MDLIKAIQELREEKKQLDIAIATLEGLLSGVPVQAGSKRGRKHMSAEERRIVSERMSNYWASRRKERDHERKKAD
jgi:hypothetical protein